MDDPTIVLLGDAGIAARSQVLAARLGDSFRLRVPAAFTREVLAQEARDVEVIVASAVSPVVLRAAERLRLLQLWIAGVDHLKLDVIRERRIQVGRSEVIEEEALYRACKEGWIAGAGIDVWYRYPPPEPCLPSRFPFHELENVVMTPHCAGWTLESLDAQVAFVADNLLRFRAGQPLRALVDLDLGY